MTDSRRPKPPPSTTAIRTVDVSAKPRGSGKPGKPAAAKPVAPRGSGNTRKVPVSARKGRSWGVAASVLVVIAGLVGAGIWLHARQPSGPHAGDLRKYLLDRPDGATKTPDLPGKDGLLDVAAMQSQSSNPAGVKTVLEHFHFAGGAITGWSTDKGRVQVMILRYGSAADATSAVTSVAASEAEALGAPTAVSGMTNGAVFASPVDAPDPYSSGFGRNGDVVIIIHEYPKLAGDLADARKDVILVLTEQNAKLG